MDDVADPGRIVDADGGAPDDPWFARIEARIAGVVVGTVLQVTGDGVKTQRPRGIDVTPSDPAAAGEDPAADGSGEAASEVGETA